MAEQELHRKLWKGMIAYVLWGHGLIKVYDGSISMDSSQSFVDERILRVNALCQADGTHNYSSKLTLAKTPNSSICVRYGLCFAKCSLSKRLKW